MQRLTIHLTNAPFSIHEQKVITDSDGVKRNRPKKAKCIQNTLSFRVKGEKEAQSVLDSVKSRLGHSTKVHKWYLSNIN